MEKKCSVCEEVSALYLVKDTKDYYCQECALQCFGDLNLLITVEQQARNLKDKINDAVVDQFSEVEDNIKKQKEEDE